MADAPQRPLMCLILPVLEPAGAERVVAELALRLPPRGFDVRVICLEDERAPLGVELAAAGVAVEGLRLSRRRTMTCAREIARRLPDRRPLILHAHLFHANLAARLAFARLGLEQRRGVRVVNTVQVVERRFRPWQFWLDRLTAPYCSLETCVSEDVRAFQQQRTGLPPSFFRVIENAVDVERFAPAAAGHGGRDAPHEGPANAISDTARAPRVLCVGRLNQQKDFPTLLRAWKIVASAHPDATLTIAGTGPERAALATLASSLALKNVEFRGFVADVPALLAQADLFVLSSLWEGLPLAVIEAMAAGVPVVATDAEGTRNLITHERTGLLAPRGDPPALATAILRMLGDGALATRLASAAREQALERFSVEKMVDAYAAVYREVIAAPDSAGSRAARP